MVSSRYDNLIEYEHEHTYCQEMLIQVGNLLFANQPTLWSKLVYIFAPDVFIAMDYPSIHAQHGLPTILRLAASFEDSA